MLSRAMALVVVAVAGMSPVAWAADPLVISVWGGNWKDTVERDSECG